MQLSVFSEKRPFVKYMRSKIQLFHLKDSSLITSHTVQYMYKRFVPSKPANFRNFQEVCRAANPSYAARPCVPTPTVRCLPDAHAHGSCGGMGCGGSKEPEPEPPPAHMMKRRASAAAQGGIDPNSIKVNLMTLPKVLKSEEAMARIKVCVSKNVLCNHLSDEYKDAVIASMKETTVKSGGVAASTLNRRILLLPCACVLILLWCDALPLVETIIKQGDLGACH